MVSFSGSGKSVEDPVVVDDVDNHMAAINAEYVYLGQTYGERGVAWRLIQQSLINEDGKMMDCLEIELVDGTKLSIYFDISKYFGKF